jgi:hypothetical protein
MKTYKYDVYPIWEWRINVLLLLAMLNELVPSSHGQCLVAAPNGSPPVPRNVCQNATLNLNQSCSYMSKFKLKSKCSSNKKTHFEYKCKPTFIFFPRISSSELYHLNESGFLLVGPWKLHKCTDKWTHYYYYRIQMKVIE